MLLAMGRQPLLSPKPGPAGMSHKNTFWQQVNQNPKHGREDKIRIPSHVVMGG